MIQFLLERFDNVREQAGTSTGARKEWSASCPLCHPDEPQRFRIDPDMRLSACASGHTPDAILEAADAFRREEPGVDDGDPEPIATAKPKAPARWEFQTAAEFLAREFPPIRWLYLDLVPAESVTVIMAAPNAGKTFFGLDVVCQVAAKAAHAGTHVCIVEEEGTGAALQWRLSRALAAVGGADPNLIRIAWNTGRNIRDPRDLVDLANQCTGAELIMLDSLSALAGGVNENDSEEMAQVAEALHQLKTRTGAAIVVLHHMTKAAWKEGETPRLEHMRGHGALPGRADAVIALVPLESDESAVNFEIHCVKQRDGSKPQARTASVAMKGEAAVMDLGECSPHTAPGGKIDHKLLSVIEHQIKLSPGITKTKLESIVEGRGQIIRRAVDQLEHSERIASVSKTDPRKGYIITPGPTPSGTGMDGADGVTRPIPSPPFRRDGVVRDGVKRRDGVDHRRDASGGDDE